MVSGLTGSEPERQGKPDPRGIRAQSLPVDLVMTKKAWPRFRTTKNERERETERERERQRKRKREKERERDRGRGREREREREGEKPCKRGPCVYVSCDSCVLEWVVVPPSPTTSQVTRTFYQEQSHPILRWCNYGQY